MDVADNICQLTAREHYIAHMLLVKMYPQNDKLKYAVFCMTRTSDNQQRHLTSWQVERARLEMAMAAKNRTGENNSFYGKKHSKKTRERLKMARAKMNLCGENNSNYGNRWTWDERGYDKSKLKLRRKAEITDEFRMKCSKAKLGANNPNAKAWHVRSKLDERIILVNGGIKRFLSRYEGSTYFKLKNGRDPNWELLQN